MTRSRSWVPILGFYLIIGMGGVVFRTENIGQMTYTGTFASLRRTLPPLLTLKLPLTRLRRCCCHMHNQETQASRRTLSASQDTETL